MAPYRYVAPVELRFDPAEIPALAARFGPSDDAGVEAATRESLSPAAGERERIESLLALRGVGLPTASVLLHFAMPDRYPILDVRALESLGVTGNPSRTVAFWLGYVDACRALAAAHGVSLRTLDKALWQHSKERSGV